MSNDPQSALGGGTTINWACCLEPPPFVREEWSGQRGLTQFGVGSPAFDTAIASVLGRIGATASQVQHNRANQLLLDGCAKLGFRCKVAPQNLKDTGAASAGWTCFGDRYGNKQGTMVGARTRTRAQYQLYARTPCPRALCLRMRSPRAVLG